MLLEVESGFHFRERDGRLLMMAPEPPDDWVAHRMHLVHRVPGTSCVTEPEGHWTGDYEVTFDHHPLVGPTGREGVWSLCGFSGHGVMQSPAVAASLAAMLVGATPPVDIGALDPRRSAPLGTRRALMPGAPEEQVLCIERADAWPRPPEPQGLVAEHLDRLRAVIRERSFFMPRREVEEDPTYLQIISFVVFRHRDRYFLTQRLRRPPSAGSGSGTRSASVGT